ncbi:Endo-1,4-beta-xylanase, GH35 family [Halomicrobium zhouii]|uniref:endo-1,4-beta-xylanase n=1 Tax=Halomicrobium zhouii TaxID=767519 RepID=A0A1I6KKT2_9EURY|nr:Endo-1,4-beta-xylanase, GH35 family [Halomicrobium zhouii]
MEREFDDVGSHRRTFLQSLAALGVLGGTGTVGTAVAQVEGADEYHNTLLSDLQENHELPQGEFVYGLTEQDVVDAFSFSGAGSGSMSTFEVSDSDVPITQGVRVEVNEEPSNNWDYSYQGYVTDRSFSAGDVLLGVAYVRSDTDGAETQAGFKYRYQDSEGSTSYSSTFVQDGASIQPDGEWSRYYFPVEIGEKPDGSDYEPYLEFWAGYAQQTLEFGGISLIDYSGTDVSVGDLPSGASDGGPNPLLDYEGRAEDAQWRQDARDRIEEIRKTDLDVEVVDGDGNAVPGATVDLAMQEHAFDFGSAVSAEHINGDSEDDEIYRETFLENFNKAVIENGLKYPAFLGEWGDSKEGAKQALDWLNQRNVPTRGHYLVWEEYSTEGGGGMGIEDPDSLTDAEVQQQMLDRITDHATDIGDEVTEWDMHNHPIWQPNIRDRLGWDAVLEWWEAGNEATDAELYTNEMGNVAGDFFRQQHYDLVERLLEDGAPVDGVGFMGHVQFPNGNVTPPKELVETYDQFAELGLPILIAEFDIQIASRDNEDQVAWQADFLRDFLYASFSHEAVEGVMSWGFWAEDHWRPTGAYYDSDWTIRPHGQQFVDLVFDEWWTEERGETGDDGVYTTRGFKGEYEVVASDGTRTGSATATVDESGTVTVQITPASIAEVDVSVDANTLWGDETATLDVTVRNEGGAELPLPADNVTYETDNPDAVMVDESGTVSVVGTGAATVTATVSAYGDTAAASARFAAYGEPTVDDQATDLSKTASVDGVEVTNYEVRHGDDARFRLVDPSQSGSITYEVDGGLSAFRTDVYVNYGEFDGDGDVYDGLTFEVSADGESFETVDVEPTTVEASAESNDYFDHRRYLVTSGLPGDASSLRVTISEAQNNWAVNVGSVEIWGDTADLDGVDATGPTVLVDGVQDGDTYEAPHPASVAIADDESDVTDETVTLNGEAFSDGQLTARGRNLLSANATSEGGVTTDLELDFEVVDEEVGEEDDLNARLVPSATEGVVGDRFTFDVRDTTGSGHWIDTIEWEFGDGTEATGWWNEHRFDSPGAYTVSLHVTDNEGTTTTDQVVVWVADLQSELAVARPSTTDADVGERVEFRVEDTSGQGRWIDTLEWDLGDGSTESGWFAATEYESSGTYTVELTATDNLGYSTTNEVEITVS